jgi:DNA-binding transcriptional LysR family regulator
MDRLRDGQSALAMIFNPPPRLSATVMASVDFPLGVVMAPTHPLNGRAPLRLGDLAGYQVAMPDASISILQQVETVLSTSGLRLRARIVSNSLAFLSAFVASGDAVTIMAPVGVRDALASGRLAFAPLADPGLPPQRLILAAPDPAMPAAAANFCEHMRQFLPTWRDAPPGCAQRADFENAAD